MFPVVIDAFSKCLEVSPLSAATSTVTIQHLCSIFATHGLPRSLVTDNGPQFTSAEFEAFMKNNGIRHIKSSPYHPVSNGLPERAVQCFKESMKKFQKNHDIHAKSQEFHAGDLVFVKDFPSGKTWLSGSVSEVRGLLSYVTLLHGRVVRHVDHIRSCSSLSTSPPMGESDVEIPTVLTSTAVDGQSTETELTPPETTPTDMRVTVQDVAQPAPSQPLRRSTRARPPPDYLGH